MKVLLCPRASQNGLVGWQDDYLKIRLTAPPVDGAANAALIKFLAERLKIPARDIELVSGLAGRRKKLRIKGVGAVDLSEKLSGLIGP